MATGENKTKLPKVIKDIIAEGFPKVEYEKTDQCGLCLRHNKKAKVTHTCDDCPEQLICESCTDLHSLYPPLKSHHIKVIKVEIPEPEISDECQVHNQHLDYYCTECRVALCFDCMFSTDHRGHENKITDLENGVSELKSNINLLNQELEEKKIGLKRKMAHIEKDLQDMDESKDELNGLRNALERHLRSTDAIKNSLAGLEQPLRKKLAMMADIETEAVFLENKHENFEALTGLKFVYKAIEYIKKIEKVIKIIEKPIEGYTTAKYISAKVPEDIGKLEPILHPPKQLAEYMKEELCLKKPELYMEIQKGGTVHLKSPREILPAGDGTVILVNDGLNDLQRINGEGNVVQVYNMEKVVKSAGIGVDNCLFVACTDNTITTVPLNKSTPRDTYRVDVDNIGRIKISGSKIIASNSETDGKIYECGKDQTKVCLSNLNKPTFVNIANCKGEQVFIITEQGNSQVNIYNSGWKLIRSIRERGGTPFKTPYGTGVTPGGKLLVVDNGTSTISEFNMNGTFVRDILSNPAINQPCGILYDYPYLWVSESQSVKKFRVD